MKKLISLILAICLIASVPAYALEPVREDKGFSDAELHWAHDYISLCWTRGLMEGTSEDVFDPDGTLTIAQCAAVAARLHIIITGGEALKETTPWYEGYVVYLKKLGCDLPKNLNAACTRQQFFDLMADIIPEGMLTPINNITSVPDTSEKTIMSFYNAGILTGMDEFGTFRGHLSLTRAECAAMLARIADYTLRVKFMPERGDDSVAMSLLYLPADYTAVTIGSYEASAALYTAVLTHEMEVISAQFQLRDHPEYETYFLLWNAGTFPGGFERYLSEIYGINEFTPTDWTATDEQTGVVLTQLALDRTIEWLNYHAAVRSLAGKHAVTLTDDEIEAIKIFLKDGNFKGESRILYTTADIEDGLLYKSLADKLKASDSEISSMLATGQYICAEYICFKKYDAKGERYSDTNIAYIRDGAELFRDELSTKANHFQLKLMTWGLKTPYIEPRPTIWAMSQTNQKLWSTLKSLQPFGVSGVTEDEDGIYIYLVSNPQSDESLMDEVCINVGYDRADAEVTGFIKYPIIKYSDAVKYLAVNEFAAKVM